jgi:hypothetical protein
MPRRQNRGIFVAVQACSVLCCGRRESPRVDTILIPFVAQAAWLFWKTFDQ